MTRPRRSRSPRATTAAPTAAGAAGRARRDLGPRPRLKLLPLALLKVDPRYQRDTASRRSRTLIERIAAEFRWARFHAIVAVRDGKGFKIIDGQHRVEAARLVAKRGGDTLKVPALVLPQGSRGASLAEAAADFVAINRDRLTVNPLQIHHAMLAAGDPAAERVQAVLDAAGVSAPRSVQAVQLMKPGQTHAIVTVAKVIAERSAPAATRVLKLLRLAYPDQPGAIRAAYILAIAAVLAGEAGAAPPEAAIVAALKRRPQRDTGSEAAAVAERARCAFWKGLTTVIRRRAVEVLTPAKRRPAA